MSDPDGCKTVLLDVVLLDVVLLDVVLLDVVLLDVVLLDEEIAAGTAEDSWRDEER